MPEIKTTEVEQDKKDNVQEEEVIVEAENQKEKETPSKQAETDKKPIPENEDVIKEGDEEEKLNPLNYEEPPKVEEKAVQEPVKEPVVVTSEVPEETSDDRGNNLVPDSENPFLKPAQDRDNSELEGGNQGSDYYQDGRKAGEGDKF